MLDLCVSSLPDTKGPSFGRAVSETCTELASVLYLRRSIHPYVAILLTSVLPPTRLQRISHVLASVVQVQMCRSF